jgi:hypothetical protein
MEFLCFLDGPAGVPDPRWISSTGFATSREPAGLLVVDA